MSTPDSEELVVIARIVKPKGLKGEVVAEIVTDFPERFDGLDSVILKSGSAAVSEIEYFRFEKDRIVLKFAGIDSIESAELLRGHEVCVSEEDAVELEEDEFFDWELVGCEVREPGGSKVGTVTEIFRAGENVNLVVKGTEKEHLIPFVKAICTEIDIESKLILAELPEGLLEF